MPATEINTSPSQETILEHVTLCCKALDDKKAEDILVLDMRGTLGITDYFIIATGTSAPHLRALFKEMDSLLSPLGYEIPSKDKNHHTGWVVVDAIDFVIHIFEQEQRDFYCLDRLWKDAPEVQIEYAQPAKAEV
jgi:ribosome-associated protein